MRAFKASELALAAILGVSGVDSESTKTGGSGCVFKVGLSGYGYAFGLTGSPSGFLGSGSLNVPLYFTFQFTGRIPTGSDADAGSGLIFNRLYIC